MIQIKQLHPGDEKFLERAAEDVFDEAIDPNYLTSYLSDPNHFLIVALSQGEVVGQIRAIIHKHPDRPDELYIDNLGVTPKLQRQGIATKLLNAMLKLGKTLGCADVWLGTEDINHKARQFYESFGVKAEPIAMYTFDLEGLEEVS